MVSRLSSHRPWRKRRWKTAQENRTTGIVMRRRQQVYRIAFIAGAQ